MKISEISVGDFVEYTEFLIDTTYVNFGQIVRIHGEAVDIMDVERKESKYINIESLKPVEIIEDFLKLNNIEAQHQCALYGFPLIIKGIGVPFMNNRKPIHYVHELQHIMRIFGKTEMADSLKLI